MTRALARRGLRLTRRGQRLVDTTAAVLVLADAWFVYCGLAAAAQ